MQTPPHASRYVFPVLGALYERCQRFAYPILRVTFGAWFIPHGCQKLFGWWGGNIAGVAKGMAAAGLEPGMFWAYYIGTLELVGGFLVATATEELSSSIQEIGRQVSQSSKMTGFRFAARPAS